MEQQNEELEIDLRELLIELMRHVWVILACTVLGAILLGVYSIFFVTPQYTSTAQIYVVTNSSSIVSLADLQMGSSIAKDYEELITSRPVVEKVAENLKLDMKYESLLSCIAVTNKENTRIIRIAVTYSDPVIAKDIANEFAVVSKKQISDIMLVDEPTIVEDAVVAESPSSPNHKRNILIGAVVGFLLAAGFFAVRFILDDTLKNTDDVERYLGINTLAAIPLEGGTDNTEKKKSKRFRGVRRR